MFETRLTAGFGCRPDINEGLFAENSGCVRGGSRLDIVLPCLTAFPPKLPDVTHCGTGAVCYPVEALIVRNFGRGRDHGPDSDEVRDVMCHTSNNVDVENCTGVSQDEQKCCDTGVICARAGARAEASAGTSTPEVTYGQRSKAVISRVISGLGERTAVTFSATVLPDED